ncbi:Holliday junction resolvase RuvX [Bacteroidota bacterium]
MGRIVSIDYGRKRVGIAVSDPLKMIANPHITVKAETIIQFLKDYQKNEVIDIFVIGYPKKLNNQGSEALVYVNPFIKRLSKEFPEIPIELVDERFTSKLASQAIIEGGAKKKQRKDKALIDTIAATIILQGYLESLRNKKMNK